jgi:hypothetical protein
MNEYVKRKWIKRLRIPGLPQTTKQLTRVNVKTGEITGQCCLGVVCEIAVEDRVVKFYDSPRHSQKTRIYYNPHSLIDPALHGAEAYSDRNDLILPDAVASWAGTEEEPLSNDPAVVVWPEWDEAPPRRRRELEQDVLEGREGFAPAYKLSTLNDAGFTFSQIADLIEWGL